jgi:oligopeptidase B
MKIVCTDTYIHAEVPRNPYAHTRLGESVSADGIPVRWLLLKKDAKTEPKGLMLVAYGAYGLTTSLKTIRWIPWLRAGWAVALLFVRGGGDGNEMWADIGRLSGKKRAVEDVEACCRDLQEVTGCGPEQTCIFGRSAGGLIIGNLISRHPSGQLFGGVYAEVPYVDLLKTASNAGLPLTAYEYHEFGNPAKGPVEFEETFSISPIHLLEPGGAPGVKVLCRSGFKDIQVYYYESLKWTYALRGVNTEDDTKILYINRHSHYTTGRDLCLELAEDFLVINHWLLKSSTK